MRRAAPVVPAAGAARRADSIDLKRGSGACILVNPHGATLSWPQDENRPDTERTIHETETIATSHFGRTPAVGGGHPDGCRAGIRGGTAAPGRHLAAPRTRRNPAPRILGRGSCVRSGRVPALVRFSGYGRRAAGGGRPRRSHRGSLGLDGITGRFAGSSHPGAGRRSPRRVSRRVRRAIAMDLARIRGRGIASLRNLRRRRIDPRLQESRRREECRRGAAVG